MNRELTPKIHVFFISDIILFNIAKSVRNIVFVQEQKVDEKDEFDSFENESTHYLIYAGEVPVGTARWRFVGEEIKLERFAVLKEYRSKGYGNKLLEKVLADVKVKGKPIYLHAQSAVLSFYANFGFVVEGDEFEECNISHYKMRLKANEK